VRGGGGLVWFVWLWGVYAGFGVGGWGGCLFLVVLVLGVWFVFACFCWFFFLVSLMGGRANSVPVGEFWGRSAWFCCNEAPPIGVLFSWTLLLGCFCSRIVKVYYGCL